MIVVASNAALLLCFLCAIFVVAALNNVMVFALCSNEYFPICIRKEAELSRK
jgi:hypothetical protein